MQQHLMQMQPMMAAYYPSNVTTDHIQQYLDENKSLILKIVESQNSGKLSECAENQARLQRNLMYLAAIADSQPQPPTMHSQYSGGGGGGGGMLQAGPHYMQQQQHHHQQQGQQQQQQMPPQSLMAARSSMLYGSQPYPSLQQQALHGQLSMGPAGGSGGGGGSMLQGEAHGLGGYPDFIRGGSNKQSSDLGGNEGRGGGSDHHGGENLYLKSAEDGN
ncbi:hypothetical protein ABFS83_06G080700 [Erythranthe nasuta]